MPLYEGYINEFVDWVDGHDTSLDEISQAYRASSTGGLPVSGKYIRELLLTRLKKPFVSYEDTIAGLYRLFSSEDVKNKWIRMNTEGSSDYDPEGSKSLELFNFVRPSDVTLTFSGLDPNPKYIINGDDNSRNAQLEFNVYLSKESGGGVVYESDSFTVTYEVTDSNGIKHVLSEEKDATFLNSTKKVTKNIYSMLSVGQNTVTVSMKAKNSSASNSITFAVFLVIFEIESSFDYSAHWDPERAIDIPISIRRSDASLKIRVDITVDGQPAKLAVDYKTPAVWEIGAGESNPTRVISIANLYSANVTSEDREQHTLQIEAHMYDLDMGVSYPSNVLLFDFIIASSTIGIVNRFINTKYSTSYDKLATDIDVTGKVILQAVQYQLFTLPWAYYTDRETTLQTINVQWATRIETNGVYTYTPIAVLEGKNKMQSEPLRFIPDFYTTGNELYLVALYNGEEIQAFPFHVQQSNLSIVETSGYNLKLNAFGKSNQSPDKNQWVDSYNSVNTTFTNIVFDDTSGWNDNSFVVQGIGLYATVNYNPFPEDYNIALKGKTIEIDFKTENVVNENDVLISIGDPNGGHINICPNKATLYNGVNPVLYTRYKANERIKLAFVFNPVTINNSSSNLVFIINDGVLERATSYGTALSYNSALGSIKIGDSTSGIRVYSIRCYDKALSYNEELNNYIYDSENKAAIINRNDIFTSSVIDYTKVKNKIDTILITGNLNRILSQGTTKDDSESTVNFRRECISDPTKNFDVVNGMIRKHGQSTLNYPITSMKLWTNKAKESSLSTTINLSQTLQAEGLNKNRYIMKTGAIPANKFVLQANYADSSGTHNGSLLRLILDTWYNAAINGKHILRTAPQLFTSGEVLVHNDSNLYEDGSWVEGYGVGAAENKTWPQLTGKNFPYTIRIAPDSFPCAVFYQNGLNDGYHFLGQYVFMDDKKSDFTYGERSIYHFGNDNDPFVLKTENTKNGPLGRQDIDENKVWDNKDVLRIEVVLPDTTLTSYMDFDVPDKDGNIVPCTTIKTNTAGNPDKYYWEDYFEMIYPDEDDIAEDDAKDGLTKFSPNSRFVRKAQPFINFLKWITDCKLNYANTTEWWSAGTYSSTLLAFEHTAALHLDLYKLAAYYIYFLRFGLVDSVERNALLKTYDGQHWHYEPWDMDIACGETNDGQLILDPPLNRESVEPGTTTYAYSGRKINSTTNTMWDCLEAWGYWADTVVPNVAQALYDAGLDYDSIMNMFDGQYADAWSESMYNESGYFKYIQNGGGNWLRWLHGSRMSHRHWWVSTSMNYYDAKWSCGDFNSHRVRIFADKKQNNDPNDPDIITIKPTSDTFLKITRLEGAGEIDTHLVFKSDPSTWEFDVSNATFSTKDPAYIYGGTFIEEIDLSCISEKLKAADFTLCYDKVLGAPIKKLSVGLPYTAVSDTVYQGKVSGTQLRIDGYDAVADTDALGNLLVLDITGQGSITTTQELLGTRNRKNVTDVYAIGSGITEFVSSTSGNRFNDIKLPAVTTVTYTGQNPTVTIFNTLSMTNSSWLNIEFWDTNRSGDITYMLDGQGNLVLDDDNNPVIEPSVATFTKTTIPYQLLTVSFKGTTASNECAGLFVLDWIDAIDNSLPVGHTEEDLYDALSSKTLEAENINWGLESQSIRFTYNDLARIAHMNNGNNSGGILKGYIVLSDNEELTVEQVNNIVHWFGNTAFTKSSKNSGLVVDLMNEYVRIATYNTEIVNGEIVLREGSSTAITATKFMLSEGATDSYEWYLAAGQNVQGVASDPVKSVRFLQGDDDVLYLVADGDGTYGDYYVTVTAVTNNTPTMLTIKIIGAILPADINVVFRTVNGLPVRLFDLSPLLVNAMPDVFRLYAYDSYNNINNVDTYMLFENNQEVEFYVRSINGQTPPTIGLTSIRYTLSSLLPVLTEYQLLTGYEDTPLNRVSDGTLYYAKCAQNRGIVVGTTTAPQLLAIYRLTAYANAGARLYVKPINIVVYEDSTVLHTLLTSRSVHDVLNTLHNSLYGRDLEEYYKSDLLRLVGELDFSSNTNIEQLVTNTNERLLTYLPNITSLNLEGCEYLHMTTLGSIDALTGVIQFVLMPLLTNINLDGVGTHDRDVIIDFSNAPLLESVNVENTNISVILPNGNNVSSLELGSPYKVSITRPKVLLSSGVSIEDSTNLNSIELVNVNTGDLVNNVYPTLGGYNIFDILTS